MQIDGRLVDKVDLKHGMMLGDKNEDQRGEIWDTNMHDGIALKYQERRQQEGLIPR